MVGWGAPAGVANCGLRRQPRRSRVYSRAVLSLEQLLTVSAAVPADVRDDGTVLVRWNVPGTFQLYLARPGQAPEQLTSLPEPVDGRFVPGTDRILLSVDQGGNERAQLYLTRAEQGAALEPLVVEPEFLHVTPTLSADGTQLAYACNRANGRDLDVYVRSLASGEERCVLAAESYCEVAGFSPDGRRLGVLRLTERTGDNDLHIVDLATGDVVLVAPEEHDAFFGAPAWCGDSESFLFATDSGRDVAGIARYELATDRWEYVIEDDWDLSCVADASGTLLAVIANVDGASRLELRDLATLGLMTEVRLPELGVVQPVRLSPTGAHLAYGFSSPRSSWEAWRLATRADEPEKLTASPVDVPSGSLVRPTLRRFSSFDGESIPYFLTEPATDGPWPVVIDVHGGPEAQRQAIWLPFVQYLAARGYAVAQPNVRGSTGYGKRYEHLDDVHLRLDTVRDLTALHDELARDERIDADRTVLYGGSYGGYMVLAGLAFEPERWAAGIGVVAISSLVTFLRNTSDYRRAFREREYGSLEHDLDFLHEVSPLTHVDRIRAPLLLVHGANDPRVPVSEAEQLHRILDKRGVPCELVVYPDEGHGLQKLENRLDAYPKMIAFLEQHLSA